MADYAAYWKNFKHDSAAGNRAKKTWYTNDKDLGELVKGDHVWIFASSEDVGQTPPGQAYLVQQFVVESAKPNTGSVAEFPVEEFKYEVVALDISRSRPIEPPILIDAILREETKKSSKNTHIGTLRQGAWKLPAGIAGKIYAAIREAGYQ